VTLKTFEGDAPVSGNCRRAAELCEPNVVRDRRRQSVQEWLCLCCVRVVGKCARLLRQIIIGELWNIPCNRNWGHFLWTLRRYSDIHSMLYTRITIICDVIYVIHRWPCTGQPWSELVWWLK